MGMLGNSTAAVVDAAAVAQTASEGFGTAGTHPVIVDALGQESVDQLIASVQSFLSGVTGAAAALTDSIKLDSLAAKGDELMDVHTDETEVKETALPETIDVDKLRAATAKLQTVVGLAHDLADALERILTDKALLGRLREAVAESGAEVDLDVVKGSLASIDHGNVPVAGVVGAALGQVTAAARNLPPDITEAVRHLEDSLGGAFQDLGRLVERLRDLAIATVDGLS